jgi:signal peptidase II
MHGRVVDMFFFPILSGHFPEWFPLWGGDEFVFFRPVFNVADASISVSVILMILFQKRIFNLENIQESNESQPENKEEPTPSEEA